MATALLQKLRIGSKASSQPRGDGTAPPLRASPNAASFLGLPPELRNAIYESLALDTMLTLALAKRMSKRPRPVARLLLVSKQASREFRPLLLAKARLSIPVLGFDFSAVVRAVEGMSQDDLHALAANPRFYLTLSMNHVPKLSQLESLATWIGYRAAGDSQSEGAVSRTSEPATPHSLRFRYDAKITPSRSMISQRNMKVALLKALIRQIGQLGGRANETQERKRMMRDLYRCTDELMGIEARSDDDIEMEKALSASTMDSPFFGVQYVPQYR
ncbi:ferrochelatase hem15 [Teratosphaeriaceae sp. CCFEE 6253]|nr:ferrochelatase hem15 [Teratosphaeriaceae sp. CCFEE 6253]